MSKLVKFPFKSMIPIVNFLHSQKSTTESSINDIQNASNACYPDTLEVVQMLAYLTTFGQVKETAEGWILINKQEKPVKIMIRKRFLEDIEEILNQLSSNPQKLSDLTKDIDKMKESEVEEFLRFLQTISSHGFVAKNSEGWKLENYTSTPSAEIQ